MAERSPNRYAYYISSLPIVQLFSRISAQHVQHKQKKRMKHLKYTFVGLLVYIIIIWFFQYDNQIYNALKGPFHINPNQFVQHIPFYNRQMKFWNRMLFSFYEEYFQIELGENHIEKYRKHPFLHSIIEPTISKYVYPYQLYVKLPTQEQSHYYTRHPFNFQSFSIKTLQCIVCQIKIPSNDYHTWLEKSIYISVIEKSYDQNATLFNKNVLIKCGILIGYIYNPRGEYQLIRATSSVYNINSFDLAIDASYSYSLTFFVLGCMILSGLLISSFLDLSIYIYYYIRPRRINIHSDIKTQFQILGIDSLYSLTELIYGSVLKGLNYRYHMFIIEDEYLIIFNVSFDEYNEQKLKLFYNESPFIVIPLSSIIEIRDIDFFINDGHHQKWIYFSSISDDINDMNASKWLHRQLMCKSPSYRDRYVEAVRQEQEKERYARQFASIVAREEEIQWHKIANSIDRMVGLVKSASPRFIAQFCLTDHPTVQSDQIDLLNDPCSICLNEFRVARKYAQWPCPGGHYFHCNCMLGVLRESNKCPLCRHPVEPTPSFILNYFSQFFS